jgi:serine phosphatase RsbU (regulator of sigma subunit)
MRRVIELEALSAAGRALVTSDLDIVALCELIAEASSKVIDSSNLQLGLFDNNRLIIHYRTVNGQRQATPLTHELADQTGLVEHIRDEKRPLLFTDLAREDIGPAGIPSYLRDDGVRSALFVPLISGERTIGLLGAQSVRPHRFDEEDLRRLTILANQSAAAIAHARLFEQAQNRAAQLELVGQIARHIIAVQSQEEIFSQVVERIRETFGFHPVSILGLEPSSPELGVKASTFANLADEELRIQMGTGFAGTSAAAKKTIVSNRVSEDRRFLKHLPGLPDTTLGTKSEIAIPLIFNDEVIGVLDVQSEEEGAFSESEITALEALAAEIAIALNKAEQLKQQREQAWLSSAMLQISEAIDRNAELEEIVAAIARLTTSLVDVSSCAILLWNDELECYRGAGLYTADQGLIDSFLTRRMSVGEWSPLDAAHVGREPISTEKQPPWFAKSTRRTPVADGRSLLLLIPLSHSLSRMGVMVIAGLRTEDVLISGAPSLRRELLENIARQSSSAIESAQLRLAQQEEAWVNTALLQVAEAVNNLIDLNEILNTIVRLVPMLVGVKSALVLIWDEESQAYRAGPSHGISAMGRGMLESDGLYEDEFIQIRTSSIDSLSPSIPFYSLRLPPWLVKVLDTPTAHAFHLYARGRMVGVMLVGTSPEEAYAFSSRRLNILNGIAQQAATAVVNNQLYAESAERSRLEQELSVAREIQASLIPDGNPNIMGCTVASYWQAARQVSGDFYDFLAFPDGKWGVVIADVADKGVAAALFMALSRTILRTVAFGRANPADVLVRTNRLLDQDAQSDLFVTVFYAIWDPRRGELTYANGGHNPPILLHNNGQIRLLRTRGMALGVLPEIHVENETINVRRGEMVLYYTDGVTEAMNEDFDEFGLDRLVMAAASVGRDNASGIINNITSAISDHAGDTAQSDDITLVVMKRGG